MTDLDLTGFTRRGLVVGSALAAFGRQSARAASTFTVGYLKYGNLARLKASGQLEEKLQPLGVEVVWAQYTTAPPLVDALAKGVVDVGSTGETPPIFAQADGAPIVYLGAEPPAPRGEAILVHTDSPIRKPADLKGKKIAFNRGSNVHYLVVKVLESAGLKPEDVTPVYLSPADSEPAFERGEVDAWGIWDPYLAAAQMAGRARTLVDGDGLVANHQFYLGSRHPIDPALLAAFKEAVARIDRRTAFDPERTAEVMSVDAGFPLPVIERAVQRQGWDLKPMDAKLVADQQAIADTFFKLGLIPKAIRISDALA